MLYQVGTITFDDAFDLQNVDEKVVADFAKHDLIDTRRDYEFSDLLAAQSQTSSTGRPLAPSVIQRLAG